MVRIKHRYLLVNVLYPQDAPVHKSPDENLPWPVKFRRPSSDRFEAGLLIRMIRNGLSDLFGDYGAGMAAGSLKIAYCSSATSTAIIRVARAHYRLVWAALSFTTRLPRPADQACVIQVVRVSGTIKKAEEEAIRRARLTMLRAQKARTRSDATPGAALSGDTEDDDLHMFDHVMDDADGDGDEDEDD